MIFPFFKRKDQDEEFRSGKSKKESQMSKNRDDVVHLDRNVNEQHEHFGADFTEYIDELCDLNPSVPRSDIVDLVLRDGKIGAEKILRQKSGTRKNTSYPDREEKLEGDHKMGESTNKAPETGTGAAETQKSGKISADTKTKVITALKFGGVFLGGVAIGVAGCKMYGKFKSAPAGKK